MTPEQERVAKVLGKLHRYGPYQTSSVCQGVLRRVREAFEALWQAEDPEVDLDEFRRATFLIATEPYTRPSRAKPKD